MYENLFMLADNAENLAAVIDLRWQTTDYPAPLGHNPVLRAWIEIRSISVIRCQYNSSMLSVQSVVV